MAVNLTASDNMDKGSYRWARLEHKLEFREYLKCPKQKVYQVSNNNDLVFAPFFLLKFTLPPKVCCKKKKFYNIKTLCKLFHIITRKFM